MITEMLVVILKGVAYLVAMLALVVLMTVVTAMFDNYVGGRPIVKMEDWP